MNGRGGFLGVLALGAVWTAGLLVFFLVPFGFSAAVWRLKIVFLLAWLLGLVVLWLWSRMQGLAWSGGLGSGPDSDTVDPTTGLPNRASFHEIVQDYLEASVGQGEKSLIVLIGVKDLDETARSYGDEEAERVMVRVSRALLDSLRGADLLGRNDKDELIAFLPKASNLSWEAISKRIQVNVTAHSSRAEKPYRITVGTGHCEFDPDSPVVLGVLLRQAYEEMEKDLGEEKT